jgi:hypothetical protein
MLESRIKQPRSEGGNLALMTSFLSLDQRHMSLLSLIKGSTEPKIEANLRIDTTLPITICH